MTRRGADLWSPFFKSLCKCCFWGCSCACANITPHSELRGGPRGPRGYSRWTVSVNDQPSSGHAGAIGLSMFVLYGILPYLTMACVMIREAARGSPAQTARVGYLFHAVRMAAAPYKESAFFWESVNAATIVSTTVTELMGGPSRTTAHIIIFGVALVLQIVVRPFDFYAERQSPCLHCVSSLARWASST